MLIMQNWALEDTQHIFNYAKRLFKDKALEKILIADCWHARKYGRTVTQCNYYNGFPVECAENNIKSTLKEELNHLMPTDIEAFNAAKIIDIPVLIDDPIEFFDDKFNYVYSCDKEHIECMKHIFQEIGSWYCFTSVPYKI